MVVHNTASTCITTVAHCVLLWSSFDRGAGLNTRAGVLRTDPRLPVQEFMSTPLSMRNGGRALSRYRRRRQIRKSMKPGEMARSVANVRLPVHRSTLNEPSSIVIRAVSFRFRLFRLSVSKYWFETRDTRDFVFVFAFSIFDREEIGWRSIEWKICGLICIFIILPSNLLVICTIELLEPSWRRFVWTKKKKKKNKRGRDSNFTRIKERLLPKKKKDNPVSFGRAN